MRTTGLYIVIALLVGLSGFLGYSYYQEVESNDSRRAENESLRFENTELSQDVVIYKNLADICEEVANESLVALNTKYIDLRVTIPVGGSYVFSSDLFSGEFIDWIITTVGDSGIMVTFNNDREFIDISLSVYQGYPYIGGFGTTDGDAIIMLIENQQNGGESTVTISYRIYDDHSRYGFCEFVSY
ncbi:MAG: hypothetical protein V3S61_00340 [Dehalococcoidales bacterium]